MIKGIIFDLDGTLLNTIEDLTDATNYALLRNGKKECSVEECKYYVGSGTKNQILRALKGDEAILQQVMSDYLYYYEKNSRRKTRPYSGILKMLKDLKRLGYKLAVFSNKPDDITKEVVDFYFNGLFDYVLGKKECYNIKPDATALNDIYDALKLDKSNTIYVGDSDIDVQTAKNASLPMVACLWGFRKKEELNGATSFAQVPADIIKIISKMNNSYFDGAIILNKRSGISSQDAILEVRNSLTKKGFYIDKIGHAGTLDPLASGILICLINNACKLSDMLMCKEKEYECTVLLGQQSVELDITGNIIKTEEVNVTNEDIDKVLSSFVGKSLQLPPIFSAIKKDGKKLYEYARNNESVELVPREIEIYSINRTSNIDNNMFSFKCSVSKGTYIRSLVRDIAQRLNTIGIVYSLNRTSTSKLSLDNSYTIEDIASSNFEVLDMLDLVSYPQYELSDKELKDVLNGKPLKLNRDDEALSLTYKDSLIAIYDLINGLYKARVVWNN